MLVGVVLRLYGLTAQVLIDDEWHGMNFVLGKTYGEVLSGFNPSDNSSPLLNVYNLWLLGAIGWSEAGLRAPSILAGLASLILLPLSIRRIVGDRAAILFTWMLAISPMLVFYSRFSRAYALLALVGFLAIVSLKHWAESGRRRHAIVFGATAATAVALHLSALIAVFASLGIMILCKLLDLFDRQRARRPRVAADLRSIAGVVLSLAAVITVILLPVIQKGSDLPWRESPLSWDCLAGAAAMASGSANPLAALAVVAASALGLLALFRSEPLLGWLVVGAAAAYAAVLAVARPKGVDHAIVVLRYAIPLVPFGLLLAAVGFDRALERLGAIAGPRRGRVVEAVAVTAGLVGLLLAGPLPETYAMPNNFTNHSAFEGGYARHTWERSDARHIYPDRVITASEVPAFYRKLREEAGVTAIVEYPYDICNYNNLFYYFQHIHGKSVIVGYTTDERLVGRRVRGESLHEPFRVGMLSADDILIRSGDPRRLSFRNMVEITDAEGLVGSGADYLVLHKSLDALAILPRGYGRVTVDYAAIPILAATYRKSWRAPIYEDESLVVFRIPRRRS